MLALCAVFFLYSAYVQADFNTDNGDYDCLCEMWTPSVAHNPLGHSALYSRLRAFGNHIIADHSLWPFHFPLSFSRALHTRCGLYTVLDDLATFSSPFLLPVDDVLIPDRATPKLP